MIENFPVCELLGAFSSGAGGAEKTFDCHRVIHFSEIDVNMPTICPLSDDGLGTCGVDTFEGWHEGSFLFGEMLGAVPGEARVYSLPLFKGSNFLKKVSARLQGRRRHSCLGGKGEDAFWLSSNDGPRRRVSRLDQKTR
jgi:hypothetical protein